MNIVIFHNPACGTSRNVLSLIVAAGYQPNVIPYLEAGWTKPMLQALFAAAGLTPREALRTSKSPAKELGLLDQGITDEALIDAMLDHPVLVNRPLVCTPKGVALCRPSEAVLALLERRPEKAVYKEDGEILYSPEG